MPIIILLLLKFLKAHEHIIHSPKIKVIYLSLIVIITVILNLIKLEKHLRQDNKINKLP